MSKNRKKEIMAAIRELDAAGEKVTVEAVRDALGSGSFSTITPIVKEWRMEKNGQQSAPAEVQHLMSDLADQIWTQAEAAASKRFAGEKFELQQKIDELVEDDDEKTKEIVRLEEEVAKLKDQIVDMEADLHNRPTDEEVQQMETGYKAKIEALETVMATLKVQTPGES